MLKRYTKSSFLNEISLGILKYNMYNNITLKSSLNHAHSHMHDLQ